MPLPICTCQPQSWLQCEGLTCARRADENQAHSIAGTDRLYAAFSLLELPDAFLKMGDLRFEVVHSLIGDGSHVEVDRLMKGLTKA